MNNGLSGRYSTHLAAWNQARERAARILRAYTSSSDLSARLNVEGLSDVASAIKQKLFTFGNTTDKLNDLSRIIYYHLNQ